MSRRSSSYHIEDSLLFKIFSLVFFVGLLAYAGYQVKVKRDEGVLRARSELETVRARLQASLAPASAAGFQETARAELARVEALRVLAVTSPQKGVLYVLAPDRGRLVDPPSGPSAARPRLELRANPLLEARLSLPFEAAGPGLRLEALMRVLGRQEIYPLLKDVMIILFAFVVAVVLFILITVTTSPRLRHPAPQLAEEDEDSLPPFPSELSTPPSPASGRPASRPPASERIAAEPPAAGLPAGEAASAAGAPAARSAAGAGTSPAPAGERSLFSSRTGLVWGEYLEERLRFELERAASFDQDMVLVLVSPDPLRLRSRSLGQEAVERIHRGLTQRLLGRYPLRDLAFEMKDFTIGLIVPDKNLDQAVTDLEAFRKAVESEAGPDGPVTVSIGISSRNGRLISQGVLLREARASLARASREGGNSLIAFRADPDKFRRVVTSR